MEPLYVNCGEEGRCSGPSVVPFTQDLLMIAHFPDKPVTGRDMSVKTWSIFDHRGDDAVPKTGNLNQENNKKALGIEKSKRLQNLQDHLTLQTAVSSRLTDKDNNNNDVILKDSIKRRKRTSSSHCHWLCSFCRPTSRLQRYKHIPNILRKSYQLAAGKALKEDSPRR
ncbi:uncharacterized protein LOC106162697 isoform X1 [Lingula anatina]|uniref:Uncharacterized protein LOC106162697 isoform X1 n=1 Tax=Lingula anatina TaxID=7574 RepID=A0A1S3IB74_LINAN|nr:uncharacterized protein LOC106162697 isoform X1 [Lingula anatina]|eukprot:XP_013395512.1 uncharacterized protein LOC106162697 isoform X1 [Lingula anatina]